MTYLSYWWVQMLIGLVMTAGIGYVVKVVVPNRKWARILMLADALAIEAVQMVEVKYPKGSNAGIDKLDEALGVLQDKLALQGYSININEPDVEAAMKDKIETVHADLTLDKGTSFNEIPGASRPIGRYGN